MVATTLRNLSVKVRLAGSFALLVLMIALLGGFAIQSNSRIRQTTTEIEDSWLPSVRELGILRYNLARHRAIAARHVLADSVEQMRFTQTYAAIKEQRVIGFAR